MSDSEARKKRDQSIRSLDQMIADHLVRAAASGELKAAPSFGKPLPEMEGWSDTPEELRMPFKILKDAGVPPPEIELFNRRARLRKEIEGAGTDHERVRLQRELVELEQLLAMRLERLRSTGKL